MKIAHVITSLHIGGAETMLCRLLRGMDRRRYDPFVIALMEGGPLEEEIKALGIPVYNVRMRQGIPSLGALRRIVAVLRQEKPDLLQGWMCHGNLAAQFAAPFASSGIGFGPKPRVFWAIHNSFQSFRAEKPLTSTLLHLSAALSRFAERVIFVSEASRAQHERIGFRKSRSCILPNAVDTEQFAPSPAHRLSVRKELGIPEESLLIGLIGRFHPQKDHANFLKAAAVLAGRESRRGVEFLLAGRGVDPQNESLTGLIRELGLAGRVHRLGERRDIPRITAALDIGASSSSSEALSLSVAEAMACAVPCVVTDVGDSASLVGKTGIVVPPRDPEALANGWACLIGSGPQGREALGRQARERIVERYGMAAMIGCYEDLYSSGGKN